MLIASVVSQVLYPPNYHDCRLFDAERVNLGEGVSLAPAFGGSAVCLLAAWLSFRAAIRRAHGDLPAMLSVLSFTLFFT